ncbi:hypothetical protein BSKO_12388 [Bryopsis sp. KO-2023]|nr:hypothetical protein BSKO_12388 [Bryopsis sp. KO-2023]
MVATTFASVLGFALLATTFATPDYGCDFFKIPKGYLETSNGQLGCKEWPSLAAAMAECRSTRECDGFSWGPWGKSQGGCLKRNRLGGYNNNVKFAGYHKTLMGCCSGDSAPSGKCYPTTETNLALKKPTMQSSTAYKGVSSRAVDGNKNPNYPKNSCTHTVNSNNPWWVVNLGASYVVTRVVITNRADCCSERLSGFSIKIGDDYRFLLNPACVTGASQGKGTKPWPCNLKGKFVAIEIPKSKATLTLCEVQVWGVKPAANGDMIEQNITSEVSVVDKSEMSAEDKSAYEQIVWEDSMDMLYAQ